MGTLVLSDPIRDSLQEQVLAAIKSTVLDRKDSVGDIVIRQPIILKNGKTLSIQWSKYHNCSARSNFFGKQVQTEIDMSSTFEVFYPDHEEPSNYQSIDDICDYIIKCISLPDSQE